MNHFPQQRTDLVTNKAIQHAPGLLRIDFLQIKVTGLLDRSPHRPGLDLIEENSLYRCIFARNSMPDMPSYGFALTIGVSSQIDGIGPLRSLSQFTEYLALATDRYITRLKTVFNVYAQFFRRQISHMPHARLDDEILAQDFVDRFGFGGRFDDHQ